MFCAECGKESVDDGKYCPHCGNCLLNIQNKTPPLSGSNSLENIEREKMSFGNKVFMVIAALVLVKCSMMDNAANDKTESKPSVNHVSKDVSVTKTQADAIVKLLRAYGYSCSSLSSALQSSYDGSFSVTCNNWKYRYDIEDVGGNLVVTVN